MMFSTAEVFEQHYKLWRVFRDAGEHALKRFGTISPDEVEHKKDQSVVTVVDRECEVAIIDFLMDTFPEHGFLAEEDSDARGNLTIVGNTETFWVVDGLDGTRNYTLGIPIFGLMAALIHERKPVAGAIYVPVLKEFYFAVEDRPTCLNGLRIPKPQRFFKSRNSILVEGGHDRTHMLRMGKILEAAEGIRSYRKLGSAACSFALVAAGKAPVLIAINQKPWDSAAGARLVMSRGGYATNLKGEPFTSDDANCIASLDPQPELIEAVKDL